MFTKVYDQLSQNHLTIAALQKTVQKCLENTM